MLVGAPGRRLLVRRATSQLIADPNALDDEHAVLDLNVALGLRREMAFAGLNLARLQRATQRAGESTCRGGDHVIERCRMRLEPAGFRPVMRRHLVVHAKRNRLGLSREVRVSQRTLDPLNPNVRDVGRHLSIVTSATTPRSPGPTDRSG